MRFSKKKRINYSGKRLINLIGEDKNTLNLEAKNVQNISYTLASEDNETSHILDVDEQGNAYINAKEEDLATFSILDNPYSLYWGSSSETGDTSYSYKPITESLNITKGAVVEPLELKKLHKISYQFFNNRKPANGVYNLDIKITGFDKDIKIKENNVDNMFFDISKHLENYLCIDIDNIKTFNLYLSHKDDNVSSEILFDASQVQNWDIVPEFYFDANSLLYIEPFVTAKFDEYLEYYKGEPVYNEMYKRLRTGFNIFDIHKIKQVIPDDAEDSQYVQTYDFNRPYTDDEVVIKKFANLSAVNMHSQDYSNCTIYLANNQNTNLTIDNNSYLKYNPPYYENVFNVESINLSIENDNTIINDFNLSNTYRDDVLGISIQQIASDYRNALARKIHNLRISSENLSAIHGELTEIEGLTLDINNELPNNFSLENNITLQTLKMLDLTTCRFKNIPHNFLGSAGGYIESLFLSDTIENIGEDAFVLISLKSIMISKNLKKISKNGFIYVGEDGSSIESLDFRNTKLETLESGSLQSSANLKIYLPTTVTNIASSTFGSNTTVYYKGTAEGAPWGAKEVITEF